MWPTTAAAPAAAMELLDPVPACAASTVATPFPTSRISTVTPSGVPDVRSTFAAPTFPLPETRTSIPARLATRNANGTEPTA
jgi:hypothetical protein